MSLSNASIPIGATFSPTGGTATSFVSLGQSEGKNKLFIDDGSSLILRKTVLATSKTPVPNASAPNGYTQQRSTIVIHQPKLLANGEYTVNTMRLEVAYDPESTGSEVAELFELAGHIASDSDFAEFREDGATA